MTAHGSVYPRSRRRDDHGPHGLVVHLQNTQSKKSLDSSPWPTPRPSVKASPMQQQTGQEIIQPYPNPALHELTTSSSFHIEPQEGSITPNKTWKLAYLVQP